MKRILLLAIKAILFSGILWWPTHLHAATNRITFTYTRIKEVNCDEGFGEACPDDYYPKLDIDAQGLDDGKSRFCCDSASDSTPNWVFIRDVDVSHNLVSIHIELWDQDDLSADDQINITGAPNKSQDIVVNLNNCTWKGGGFSGVLNGQSSTTGNGKDSAEVYFTITSTSPGCQDTDGDGLLDVWEKNGIDVDGDGVIDVNLPAMGADPNKKDLFLQLDFLVAANHTHQPLQAAIQSVVQAFANAPVGNPDGTTGIQLHVDVGSIYGAGVITTVTGNDPNIKGTFGDYLGGGQAIPEAGNTIVDYSGSGGATNFYTLKKMNPNRNNIFRYGMFVHQTNARVAVNDCTSGLSNNIPGANFFVSLGGIGLRPAAGGGTSLQACWGVDGAGQSVGTQVQQAGTLMHEFGHTLGLKHGGSDNINNKPNYLSVMSYFSFSTSGTPTSEQACGVVAIPAAGIPGGCDYSRVLLPTVNENSVDECQGIDGGLLGLGAIDFNNDSILEGASNCQPPNNTNVTANVNFDTSADANNNGVQDPGEPPILGTLTGFNDWPALVYNFRTVFDFPTAGSPQDPEPDPQSIDAAKNAAKKMVQPQLKLTAGAPAVASPGDSISYNIRLENRLADGAHGPAVNVKVTAATPVPKTVDVGNVALNASINKSVSDSVPCAAVDGSTISTNFKAHGSNLINDPIDLVSTAQTVVRAPVMSLSKKANPSVNAGEAITYEIQYENTGSAQALNVVISDLVPKDVYYSPALDQGSGPKPATVTLNPDGTRTLAWKVGNLPPHSQTRTITLTARPTLLALVGTEFTNNVSLEFQKGAACPADALHSSARTTITEVYLRHEHEPHGACYWKYHARREPAEILARIQASDQRFDGKDGTAPDGALSQPEVKAAFRIGNLFVFLFHPNRPLHLERHLLALYFNLGTRRLNASTAIKHDHETPPGLINVSDAGRNAQATLTIPYSEATEKKYHSAKEVLKKIND